MSTSTKIPGISITATVPLMCINWNFVWSSQERRGQRCLWESEIVRIFQPLTPSQLWALIPFRNIQRPSRVSLASLGSWLWNSHPTWNQWGTHLNSLFPQNHRHLTSPRLPNPRFPRAGGPGAPRELIQLFPDVSTVFLRELWPLEFARPCPCSHKKPGASGNYGIKSSLPLILTLQPRESQRVLLFSFPLSLIYGSFPLFQSSWPGAAAPYPGSCHKPWTTFLLPGCCG